MVDKKSAPIAWATLLFELEDTQEHLQKMCLEMNDNPQYDEVEFAIDMAHIYSHLNRAWNGRNATEKQIDDQNLWRQWSQFPADLEPL
ncbi:hypothetical protein [uncultured Hymenobacter sp.]|uniref:hypothetical protein n=1 Tax=uncultured Hymenobacter sp. TaxID=170016 RepID=UPI0035CA37B3